MAANYVLLERIELNASAASVTFSNIPQSGYTDLKVVVSARTDYASTNDNIKLSFNNSTASFSGKRLYGSGTAAASDSITDNTSSIVCDGASATSSTFSNSELYLTNYLSGNYKSYSIDAVAETNATTTYSYLTAGLWSNTAAITSMSFTPQGGTNFVQYSTFSLYGLAAVGTTPVIAPKASGGNITTDGTYWYHTFLASGTFTPATNLTCDYLVVAGGGGSGRGNGTSGGGGAGGLRSTVGATGGGGSLESALATTASTSYAITVGAGGTNGATRGVSGNNSTFSTITAIGGGASGGGNPDQAGLSGGSGGGGGEQSGIFGTGGVGTANQGYAGGQGNGSPYHSGGGGGAGAVGGSSNGNGGAGVLLTTWANATSTGASGYYAGGGGGAGSSSSTGGAGGGGNGSSSSKTEITAGTANTGGGAGGGYVQDGTNGGSGIVIIRYTIA